MPHLLGYPARLDCAESTRTTPWSNAGGANISFFSPHNLSCPAFSTLTRFQLQTHTSGQVSAMSFNYTCQAPIFVTNDTLNKTSNYYVAFTLIDLMQNGALIFCPDFTYPALQQWRVEMKGAQARISYTCAKVTYASGIQCEYRETAMSDNGGGQNIYFNRHNVQCGC